MRGSTLHLRTEPLHLDGSGEVEVEYEIFGNVSPYRPATRDDPPEGGEVEIDEVVLVHDPRTPEKTSEVLPSDEWPFDDKELHDIEERIAQSAADGDYDDYDEDPPERDDDYYD